MAGLRSGGLALQLGLLLLLAAICGHGKPGMSVSDPQPPSPVQAPDIQSPAVPFEILELSVLAMRYLRAFTQPCWHPVSNESFPYTGNWMTAIAPLAHKLAGSDAALIRLLTGQQALLEGIHSFNTGYMEHAADMIEMSLLLQLYPHRNGTQLADWHAALAAPTPAFASRRLQLAHTLLALAKIHREEGLQHLDINLMDSAYSAASAAAALLREAEDLPAAGGVRPFPGQPSAAEALEDARRVIADLPMESLEVLTSASPDTVLVALEMRGIYGHRPAQPTTLAALASALAVPIQVDVATGMFNVGASIVIEAAEDSPPPSPWRAVQGAAEVAVLVGDRNQLQDVGIQCSTPDGLSLLTECVRQVAALWDRLVPHRAAPATSAVQLHTATDFMEGLLWRVDQILEGASFGARSLRTGHPLIRQSGFQWQLGRYMTSRLYPGGVGAPSFSMPHLSQRPPEAARLPPQLCLDISYFIDSVLQLGEESRPGVKHALDNLHFAQFQAGGADAFWGLLGTDDPIWAPVECPAAPTTPAQPPPMQPPPPLVVPTFDAIAERQLQQELVKLTSAHTDPFVPAFFALCLVVGATGWLYTHRKGQRRGLSRTRSGRGVESPGVSTFAQRTEATAALHKAIAAKTAGRLAAAVAAAEEVAVDKQLVEKGKALLQALKKARRTQVPERKLPTASRASGHRPTTSPPRTPAPPLSREGSLVESPGMRLTLSWVDDSAMDDSAWLPAKRSAVSSPTVRPRSPTSPPTAAPPPPRHQRVEAEPEHSPLATTYPPPSPPPRSPPAAPPAPAPKEEPSATSPTLPPKPTAAAAASPAAAAHILTDKPMPPPISEPPPALVQPAPSAPHPPPPPPPVSAAAVPGTPAATQLASLPAKQLHSAAAAVEPQSNGQSPVAPSPVARQLVKRSSPRPPPPPPPPPPHQDEGPSYAASPAARPPPAVRTTAPKVVLVRRLPPKQARPAAALPARPPPPPAKAAKAAAADAAVVKKTPVVALVSRTAPAGNPALFRAEPPAKPPMVRMQQGPGGKWAQLPPPYSPTAPGSSTNKQVADAAYPAEAEVTDVLAWEDEELQTTDSELLAELGGWAAAAAEEEELGAAEQLPASIFLPAQGLPPLAAAAHHLLPPPSALPLEPAHTLTRLLNSPNSSLAPLTSAGSSTLAHNGPGSGGFLSAGPSLDVQAAGPGQLDLVSLKNIWKPLVGDPLIPSLAALPDGLGTISPFSTPQGHLLPPANPTPAAINEHEAAYAAQWQHGIGAGGIMSGSSGDGATSRAASTELAAFVLARSGSVRRSGSLAELGFAESDSQDE